MGNMLTCWEQSAETTCPNCNWGNEDADHLNKCRNKEQKELLLQHIIKLKEWMIDHSTYYVLMEWVPKYLARQWMVLFFNLREMFQAMRKLVSVQEKFGW